MTSTAPSGGIYTTARSSDVFDDQFNDWGGRGCNNFFHVLVRNGTKIAPTVEIFDQSRGQM